VIDFPEKTLAKSISLDKICLRLINFFFKELAMFRQGDVLLIPVDNMPNEAQDLSSENGRFILARGEATGHHHSVDATKSRLYSANGKMYLRVDKDIMLEHQEHDPIDLKPGNYEVRLQRQYHPTIEYRQNVD
jgi:hypothetical protein